MPTTAAPHDVSPEAQAASLAPPEVAASTAPVAGAASVAPPSAAPPAEAAAPAVPSSSAHVAPAFPRPVPSPATHEAFVEAWAIRAAAEAAGLRLADGVYANVAAALNARQAPGPDRRARVREDDAGARDRAGRGAGRARAGATVVTAAPRATRSSTDAAARGRWVIADELDQAELDAALKPLSTLLAGVPVTVDGEEAEPADGWRIVATWNGSPPRGAAVLGASRSIEVASTADRRAAQHCCARQRPDRARQAVETLLALGLARSEPGVFLDAARPRRGAHRPPCPTDASTLARRGVRRLRRAR